MVYADPTTTEAMTVLLTRMTRADGQAMLDHVGESGILSISTYDKCRNRPYRIGRRNGGRAPESAGGRLGVRMRPDGGSGCPGSWRLNGNVTEVDSTHVL